MKDTRVLIVGINYAPEPVGIGPYTQGLAEALVAAGASVEAVVAKPYYPQWRTGEAFSGGGWRRSTEAGVNLTRCPIYVPANPSGLRRVIHLASFALSALPVALRAARQGCAPAAGGGDCSRFAKRGYDFLCWSITGMVPTSLDSCRYRRLRRLLCGFRSAVRNTCVCYCIWHTRPSALLIIRTCEVS